MKTITLPSLLVILGTEIVGDLIRVPPRSVATLSLSNVTPDLAGRIELIGQVVWCLLGTYDNNGMRHWFYRRRSQLSGYSPSQYLGTDWFADSPSAIKVLNLARALI